MENLLNTIFEPICTLCRQKGSFICPACFKKCRYHTDGYCIVCERPTNGGVTHSECMLGENAPERAFSAFVYDGNVRACIKKAKYNSMLFAGIKRLTYEAVEFSSKCGQNYDNYLVMPVPISKQREKERGFNQAGIIAQIVSREFKLKTDFSTLARVVSTVAQHGKSREERFINLSGVFKVSKPLNQAQVLLIDDICTSGATLIKASQVLLENGARSVSCFTLARRL